MGAVLYLQVMVELLCTPTHLMGSNPSVDRALTILEAMHS